MVMGFRFKWVFLALLVFIAGQPERCAGELPKIRVGLIQHRESVSFSGEAGVTIQDLSGERVIAWAPSGETWQVSAQANGLLVASPSQQWPVDRGVRLLPPEDGLVRVYGVTGHWDGITDRDYRGAVEVVQSASGSLTAVNVLDIETYLRGVVPSEMPARYPKAALQAQAVAARGQALMKAGRHRSEGFDLCATEHCQVYGGATREDPNSDQAVASTWGEVLEYDGRLADTLYSSNCGGHTANNEDYWHKQRAVPYLRATVDYDPAVVDLTFPLAQEQLKTYLKYAPAVNCNQPEYAKASRHRWWSVVPREQLAQSLTAVAGDFGGLLDVRVTDRADSGLVRELAVIGTKQLVKLRGGAELRRALGGINSASFAIEPIREKGDPPVAFAIWGAGWGHQVGLCQVGAAGLADKGWDYRQILSKYYTGCTVVRRY
jgi:SpoIID/LytB domain protein